MLQKLCALFLLCYSSLLLSQPLADLEQAVNEMTQIVQQPYRFSAKQQACEKVLKLAPDNTATYLEASFYLAAVHIEQRQPQAAKNWIDKIEQTLLNKKGEAVKTYWVYWNYLKAQYANDIEHNKEKAIIYGLKAFFDTVDDSPILPELCLLMVDGLAPFGQYEQAQEFLDIYKMFKPYIPPNDIDRGWYFMGLANAYFLLEKEDLAVKTIKKAMKLLSAHHATEKELVEECQFLLAYYSQDTTAFSIVEKIVNGGNRDYRYLVYLASFYEKNKIDAAKALPLLQGALVSLCPEFKEMDIRQNPPSDGFFLERNDFNVCYIFIAKVYALLAMAEQADSSEKAKEWINLALKTGDNATHIFSNWSNELDGFDEMSVIANEITSLMLSAQVTAAATLYKLTQTATDLERLFYYTEQRKCLSLHHALADSPLPKTVQQEKKAYEERYAAYGLQSFLATSDEEQYNIINEIYQFLRSYEVFQEKLQKESTTTRIAQANLQFLQAKDIQASLDESTAFLQLNITFRDVYGILITKEGYQVARLSTIAEYDEIPNFVQSINHPLIVQKNRKRKFIQASHGYYKQLFGPFAANLKGKKKLIISPDRELFNLPFELLLTTPEEKPFNELDFLIKEYEIEYQYSATLHQKIQQRPAPKDYSLLTFAPVFENGKGTGTTDRSVDLFKDEFYHTSIKNDRFVPLPNSLREVETISQLYADTEKVTTLLKANATKKNLSKHLQQKGYHFVHIASHSIVNPSDYRASTIVCYEEADAANLYFANEIQVAAIQADLVVLSSCESGIGLIIEGEGLIGLNRSFIYAGAKNLLFSLWKVNDQYTADLMIDFYKNYKTTEDYSQALRLAKLKMLENPITANPRFWASFVLIGE